MSGDALLLLNCPDMQIAAVELRKVAEQWEDKDYPMLVAVMKIAQLLMEMAKFTR